MIHPDRLRMMGRSAQPALNTSSSGPLEESQGQTQNLGSSSGKNEPNTLTQDTTRYQPPLQPQQQPQPQQQQASFQGAQVHAGYGVYAQGYGYAPPIAVAQPQAASSPAWPTVPPKVAGDWTEYKAQDGRSYFFNSRTKVTQWDEPEEFKQSTPAPIPCVWKAFTDRNTGKEYYYNSLTRQSVWVKPPELIALETSSSGGLPDGEVKSEVKSMGDAPESGPSKSETLSVPAASDAAPVSTSESATSVASVPLVSSTSVTGDSGSPSPIVVKGSETQDCTDKMSQEGLETVVDPMLVTPFKSAVKYQTKEEAAEAFMSLLKDHNVESSWTWEQALPLIITDKRYSAFSTLSERKRVFDQYRELKAEEEENEREMKISKARTEFLDMLRSETKITCGMRFAEAASLLSRDPRFTAVDSSRERERLFYEYLDAMEEEERKRRRASRSEKEDKFRALLKEMNLKGDAQWREVQRLVSGDNRADALDDMGKLKVFEEVIGAIRHEEDQKAILQQDQRRQTLRKQREQFRALLEEKFRSERGELHLRTMWKDFVALVKDDPRYACFSNSDEPQTLFDDFCDELEDRLNNDRRLLKSTLKELDIILEPDTDVLKMCSSLKSRSSSLELVLDSNLRALVFEYVDAARSKASKATRKQAKHEAAFSKLLYKKVGNPDLPWSQAQSLLDRHSAYRKLDKDSRSRLYQEHVAMLRVNRSGTVRTSDQESKAALPSASDEGSESKSSRRYRQTKRARTRSRSRSKNRSRSRSSGSQRRRYNNRS